MFSHWRKLIMTTVMVLASTIGHSSIAAPKPTSKGGSDSAQTIKLALNKKKQKKHRQVKQRKKSTKTANAKQDASASRWQAPAQKADAQGTGNWIPKHSAKSSKGETGKKPKKSNKVAGQNTKKASKTQAKAKKKPAETPKAAPKTPVVSITPPDTAPKREPLAVEEQDTKKPESAETDIAPAPTEPKTKTSPKKGLSAKSLKAQKRPPMADIETGPDTMADSDSNAGASFLMLLTFLVASAGTFVYFKRREELSKTVSKPAAKASTQGSATPKSAPKKTNSKIRTIPPTSAAAPQTEEPPAALAATAPIPQTEPCTFERFAEMQVALSCWIEQGTDAMSSMQTFFHITEAEWLTISSYWNQRYLADDELIRQFNNLAPDFRAKYGGTAA